MVNFESHYWYSELAQGHFPPLLLLCKPAGATLGGCTLNSSFSSSEVRGICRRCCPCWRCSGSACGLSHPHGMSPESAQTSQCSGSAQTSVIHGQITGIRTQRKEPSLFLIDFPKIGAKEKLRKHPVLRGTTSRSPLRWISATRDRGTLQEFSHLEFPDKMSSERAGFKVPEQEKNPTLQQQKNPQVVMPEPPL